MRVIYAMLLLLFVAVACEKDKFTTKPQLAIKRVNSDEIFGNQNLVFTIRLTDKEGDFTSFFGISANTPGCPASNFTDSTLFQIPNEFIDSKQNEGEIVLTLSKAQRHSNLCPGPGGTFKTDTTTFKFWTKDDAGNVSDTVWSDPVIIHAN
jgi:hypothetical protein